MSDWYIENWLDDSMASTTRVLASRHDQLTGDELAELQAELDVYKAALNFIRAGRTAVRSAASEPSPDVIGMIRDALQHSRERAIESLHLMGNTGHQETTRSLREDITKIDRLSTYLESYWTGLPRAD